MLATGNIRVSRATPHFAMANPATPPIAESSKLSVSNCRIRRMRLAPIATRRAISLRRAMARVNSRLATLVQAISKTNPTVASKTRSVGRTAPTTFSCRGTTVIPSFALLLGN